MGLAFWLAEPGTLCWLAGTGPLGHASWLELVHWGFLAGSNWSTGACWMAETSPLGIACWLELVHWYNGILGLSGWLALVNWDFLAG